MAEEILEPAEKNGFTGLKDANLVKDGPNEILGKALQCCKINNKAAKQKDYLDKVEQAFTSAFVILCWKLPDIGISREQVSEILSMGEEYIVLLNKHVDKKTRFRTKVHKTLLCGSVVGGLFAFVGACIDGPGERLTNTWTYQASRKILENAYGKEYFPMEALRKHLQKS